MDQLTTRALRRLDAVANALEQLPRVGAQAYANGGGRAKPIVDRHFTPGNAQRYGWPPLSREYAMRKAGQAGALRKGMKAAGRTVSNIDKSVPFRSSTGTMSGEGAGANLPMLVRSGETREAVNSRQHLVAVKGDIATITFRNLPQRAKWLHEGTTRMPIRSPVEPNALDAEEIKGEMRRYMDRVVGTGGDVAVSGDSVPDRARFASNPLSS